MERSGLKILVIDDNQGNLTVLQTTLREAFPGARISLARDGVMGIALARAEDPDVILLDLVLPGMDGCEVCRTLKNEDRLHAIPVVILTALETSRESRIRALEEGAEAFLTKPCAEAELIAQIRAMAKIKAATRWQEQETQRLTALVAQRTSELEKELAECKRTEEALRQSWEEFRDLVENINDLLFVTDNEGRLTYVSPVVQPMFGYLPSEVIGGEIWPHIPAEDVPGVEKVFRGALKGHHQPIEFRITTKAGALRWVRASSQPIREGGQIKGLRGMLVDITERKEAEELLRHSQRWLEESNQIMAGVLTHTHMMAALLDPQFNFIWVNRAYAEAGRHEPSFFTGKNHFDLYPHAENQAIFERVVATGEPFFAAAKPFEYANQPDCGVTYWDWSLIPTRNDGGTVTGLVFTLADVTARVQAEEALRQSEERFRQIFEEGPIGVATSGADYRFLSANAAFCTLMGRTQSELRMLTFRDLTHPDDLCCDSEWIQRLTEGEIPVYRTEKRYLRHGAQTVWGSLTVTMVKDAEGKFQYFLIMLEDITERRQADEALRLSEERLRALASELSLSEERERRRIAVELHDHTCQDLVLARMKLDELQESVSAAQAGAYRDISRVLNDTIEGVRELMFELSSPTLYKFGLAAALEELLEDKLAGEPDLEYAFSDDGRSKPLREDVQVLLFQSVRELLINVLKHARAHKVALDIRRAGDSIRVTVTDDGIGFDLEEVSSLPARHHGFGLFSIRERLDCIGGALEIDAQRGVGSRFVLVAPLKRGDQDSGRKHDDDADSAGG